LEDVLLGSIDPSRIVSLIDSFCRRSLDRGLRRVMFYRRGVGAVFGLLLSDEEHIVLKVHRRDLVGEGLKGVRAIQQGLADLGFPAPRPIGPARPLGNGIGTAEAMLEVGEVVDPHHGSVRRVLAEGLVRFVDAATPMLPDAQLPVVRPFDLTEEDLWPTPHDLRFDFSLEGADWIDALGHDALTVLRRDRDGRTVVGHADWKIENVRLSGSDLVAVFDWDSVCMGGEEAFVGANSTIFACDWSDPSLDPYPSAAETSAFIADYEAARGRRFTSGEHEVIDAARVYRVAYGARCEHSDAVLGLFPGRDDKARGGWGALLRSLT
jgi:hypothetical protein